MPDETPASTHLSVVLGGVQTTLRFLNGSTESLLVRELPVSELPLYAQLIDDEARAVELFCKRPAGFSDSLTRESFLEALTTGEKLNLPFFKIWIRRRIERARQALPDFDRTVTDLGKAIFAANTSSPSPTSASPSV